MCEQELSVNTFRIKGCVSPVAYIFSVSLPGRGDGNTTLASYHVRNLDDRIDACLGKYTFSSSTLDIKTEYP